MTGTRQSLDATVRTEVEGMTLITTAARRLSLWVPTFSARLSAGPSFPTRFRQTNPELWLADYRLACQLGRADDDLLIIRNLPLHLADSARAWLEHLPSV